MISRRKGAVLGGGGQHKKMPAMKTTQPIPCTQCGKGWRDNESLRKHIENAHGGAAVNNLRKGNSDVVEIMDDDVNQGKSFERCLVVGRLPSRQHVLPLQVLLHHSALLLAPCLP